MRKMISAAMAVLLAASLTACQSSSSEQTPRAGVDQDKNQGQEAGGKGAGSASYPEKTIQVIVPFNAGSTTDTQCRFILPYLEKELGVSMAVVNNGGASGVIGTTDFLTQKADGYTVLFSLPTPTLYKAAAGETEYAVEELVPVSKVTSAPMYLIVKNDSPYENAEALIEFMKANPGKFTYGNAGNGGIAHMAVATFLHGEGLEATSVPFSGGSADSYTAVMGGHIDSYSGNENELLGRDDVRPLLNLGTKSFSPDYAEIPTLEELGFPGYVTDTFSGFYFSKDVDPAIVARFDEAVKNVTENPDFIEAAKIQSFPISYKNSEDFTAEIGKTKENILPVFEELSGQK